MNSTSGGILNGDPNAARVPGTDVLQLFYRGTDNSVYTRWRNPRRGSAAEEAINIKYCCYQQLRRQLRDELGIGYQ